MFIGNTLLLIIAFNSIIDALYRWSFQIKFEYHENIIIEVNVQYTLSMYSTCVFDSNKRDAVIVTVADMITVNEMQFHTIPI